MDKDPRIQSVLVHLRKAMVILDQDAAFNLAFPAGNIAAANAGASKGIPYPSTVPPHKLGKKMTKATVSPKKKTVVKSIVTKPKAKEIKLTNTLSDQDRLEQEERDRVAAMMGPANPTPPVKQEEVTQAPAAQEQDLQASSEKENAQVSTSQENQQTAADDVKPEASGALSDKEVEAIKAITELLQAEEPSIQKMMKFNHPTLLNAAKSLGARPSETMTKKDICQLMIQRVKGAATPKEEE